MIGTQWVVKSLKQHGVKTVFGYPGGQIMPLYDALYDGGLEHVLCRHEQGAAMAAIGYARSTGKTGVCFATSGPGATNLLTGLADAYLDSVPVIAITGQVPRALIGTDAFQEIDILSMSFACTKHSFLVDSAESLPGIIEQAFQIASSGRPGPVLIDIPKDIQLAEADYEQFSHFASQCSEAKMVSSSASALSITTNIMQNNLSENTTPSPITLSSQTQSAITLSLEQQQSIELAKAMIAQASKPMLYVGGGVTMSRAMNELRQFVATTQIPSVATLKGLGNLDIHDPYYLGLIGMHGFKPANLAVQSCDLLIAVGVRFDDRVTGNLNEFARDAKVIHIDIDPAELGKLKQAHIGIEGDAKSILPYLTQSLNIQTWHQQIQSLKETYPPQYDHPGKGIYAPLLLKLLSDHLLAHNPEKTVVTTDVGQHQMWAAQHMRFIHPYSFMTSSGLGTMGFGLPAAVGAQVARPDDLVICVSGDGSFMMNVQELTTIKRKKLPVKIVLIDNARLGMVRQWQQLFFDERYSETDLSDNPDFLVLASAFNIPGIRISKKEEVESGLQQLFASKGPFLLHVSIDAMENVWPLVPPGAANENMLESATTE